MTCSRRALFAVLALLAGPLALAPMPVFAQGKVTIGVALAQALVAQGHVVLAGDGGQVTRQGSAFLDAFGLDLAAARRGRRCFCRPCLDWSERLPHLGGAVGAALARRCFNMGWIERRRDDRSLLITRTGRAGLAATFGVELEAPAATSSSGREPVSRYWGRTLHARMQGFPRPRSRHP